ncbi:MAG: response regulator transcription factor [Campylobacterales bacterium]|nr:response regulator transcription factor [Campylobacterales bacterium]
MERKEDIEIVVVEDEEDILELIEYHLQKEGYRVTGFLSTDFVERFLEEESPSLIIMDRNLPGVEGSEFIAHIRNQGYDIPVIFLTARDQESDLLQGFSSGGDDYMTKPFSPKELIVRVRSLLKRSGLLDTQKLRYRDLILDTAKRELFIEKQKVELTKIEYKLLHTFIKNPNISIERDFLREEVWGEEVSELNDKTINVAMNRLKKKIDPDSSKHYISPVWGVGYKLT